MASKTNCMFASFLRNCRAFLLQKRRAVTHGPLQTLQRIYFVLESLPILSNRQTETSRQRMTAELPVRTTSDAKDDAAINPFAVLVRPIYLYIERIFEVYQ